MFLIMKTNRLHFYFGLHYQLQLYKCTCRIIASDKSSNDNVKSTLSVVILLGFESNEIDIT